MSSTVTLDDVWKLFQETDRKMQETDRRMQETDRRMQETTLQLKETDRLVKDVARQVGNLSSRWGEFVEGIIAPACDTLFAQRGIPVHQVHPRVRAKLPGNRHMEIDLLVVDGTDAVLIEVKSRLRVEDVREHMERLTQFKEFFPRYAECRILGAVAGLVIEEEADRFASNNGLFVIVQSGESVTLANADDFIPRAW
ncbi:MAG: DUF3782 domain-containing protein [Magnetococcales bacterium]|nr:DUF3782 domain-containing protein [Magnetococcales bacterium]